MVSVLYITCTVSKLKFAHIPIQCNVISRHATRTQNPDMLHGVVGGNVYIRSVLYYIFIFIIQRNSDKTLFCCYTAGDNCRQKVLSGNKACTVRHWLCCCSCYSTQSSTPFGQAQSHVGWPVQYSLQLLCQCTNKAEINVSEFHLFSRNTADSVEKSVIKVQGSKFIDTGGGFLLEEKVGDDQDDEPVWTLDWEVTLR